MSFFPPEPDLPEYDQPESHQPRWWSAPEDELPALYSVSELLGSTEHVAIALIGAFVYRDGVELRVERRLRRKGMPLREWNDLCSAFTEHGPFGGRATPGGRLRFGVVLGDGETVLDSTPFFGGGDPSSVPEHHTLTRSQNGGGGDGHNYSMTDRLWLWPAPPEGSIELVLQWPDLDVPEQRTYLDATEMLRLAANVKPLWG